MFIILGWVGSYTPDDKVWDTDLGRCCLCNTWIPHKVPVIYEYFNIFFHTRLFSYFQQSWHFYYFFSTSSTTIIFSSWYSPNGNWLGLFLNWIVGTPHIRKMIQSPLEENNYFFPESFRKISNCFKMVHRL